MNEFQAFCILRKNGREGGYDLNESEWCRAYSLKTAEALNRLGVYALCHGSTIYVAGYIFRAAGHVVNPVDSRRVGTFRGWDFGGRRYSHSEIMIVVGRGGTMAKASDPVSWCKDPSDADKIEFGAAAKRATCPAYFSVGYAASFYLDGTNEDGDVDAESYYRAADALAALVSRGTIEAHRTTTATVYRYNA